MHTITVRYGFLLMLLTLGIAPFPGYADPAGGNGGEVFNMDCPNGQFLVGITGTTGWYVDEIRIFCGEYDATGMLVVDSFNPQGNDIAGEPGNEPYNQMCTTASQVVTGFSGLAGAYVDAIATTCTETDGSASNLRGPDGGAGGSPYSQICPQGQVARGIRGRSGWWIDQVEINCSIFCVTPPDDVQLLTPQHNTEGSQPTFAWTPASFEVLIGVQFQLCVFTDPFNSCNVLNVSVSGTVFTPDQPLDFQGQPLVGWAVRSLNTCGAASEFSATQTLFAPGQGNGAVVGPPPGPDYRPLCNVYKDDRCSICHGGPQPVTDPPHVPFPAQTDAQGRYNDDNCTGCHYVVHPDNGNNVWEFPPGLAEEVPNADLQTFADPASCGDICRSVRNWVERDHDFIHHIQVDPLVAYGFNPSLVQGNPSLAQAAPVQEMDHDAYIDLSTSWYRAGMPCDPINDDFPGGVVSTANAGSDSADTGKRLPPIPPGKVGIPEVDQAWWINPKPLEPDLSKLPPQVGVPPECRKLVRQPARASLMLELRKKTLKTDDFTRQQEELRKLCKKLSTQ